MEPGHPPRQDPPTEHGHDQVNGSPPPPKSRRGWMSDSPLDGGSGWPTSAYAIVPRQPAPRDETPVAETPVPPPAEEPKPAPPSPRRKGRLAVLAVGLIVLVLAAVGGVLATRGNSAEDATVVPTPTAGETTGEPAAPVADPAVSASGSAGASGSGSPAASAGSSASGAATADPSSGASTLPAVLPSTAILRAGTAQFVVLAGQPDDPYDLDSGIKQTAGADLAVGALGLTAANGAKLAVLISADTPSLAACSAVPADRWAGQVVLASLQPGSKVCVRTSDDRSAWFMARAGVPVTGALYTADLDYIVYKKTGD